MDELGVGDKSHLLRCVTRYQTRTVGQRHGFGAERDIAGVIQVVDVCRDGGVWAAWKLDLCTQHMHCHALDMGMVMVVT